MITIEFCPDPTSTPTPTNHAKSSQRPLQPNQRPNHHLLNLPKRADCSPISHQLHTQTVARGQLPK